MKQLISTNFNLFLLVSRDLLRQIEIHRNLLRSSYCKFEQANGQAMVTFIFFVLIAMTIISAGVMVMITNGLAASKFESGSEAYYVAESGVENAILRLLRDPRYCDEDLSVGTGTATIAVRDTNNSCNGVSPYTITVTGKSGSFSRVIQVNANHSSEGLAITSWEEI